MVDDVSGQIDIIAAFLNHRNSGLMGGYRYLGWLQDAVQSADIIYHLAAVACGAYSVIRSGVLSMYRGTGNTERCRRQAISLDARV